MTEDRAAPGRANPEDHLNEKGRGFHRTLGNPRRLLVHRKDLAHLTLEEPVPAPAPAGEGLAPPIRPAPTTASGDPLLEMTIAYKLVDLGQAGLHLRQDALHVRDKVGLDDTAAVLREAKAGRAPVAPGNQLAQLLV